MVAAERREAVRYLHFSVGDLKKNTKQDLGSSPIHFSAIKIAWKYKAIQYPKHHRAEDRCHQHWNVPIGS